jgi:hypothetical protein
MYVSITSIFSVKGKAKQETIYYSVILACSLLVLLFDTEDGGDAFLRTVSKLKRLYKALQIRIWHFFIVTAARP